MFKEKLIIYCNGFRRYIVQKLLGNQLLVETRNTPDGYKWRLVDMKRRIPYKWVSIHKTNDGNFKIIPW